MPDPTPDQTFARLAITARITKAAETDLCPTGFFTNRQDISQCVTHYGQAPKSRLASGGKCGAGETLERGKYCSGTTTLTPSEMGAAATADFNDLYTMLMVKNGSAPNLSNTEPEIFAATASQRQAAKAQQAADEKAKADAAAPKQLGSYDPNCTPYLPNIAAANNCQQMVLDTRAQQAALGIAPPGGGIGGGAAPAVADVPAGVAADALKQGLKGLFGK